MIAKQLTSIGQMWIYYLQTYTYAYKSFALNFGLSLFQLTNGRPPKVLAKIETNVQEGNSRSFKE